MLKENSKTKYIFILGSIMSGLGKGILASSIGKILQTCGFIVYPIKFDGYLNVDCGTMNPFRHGEVFVLDDGTECDMDLGTYERFLNISLNSQNSITGGKLFKKIIEKERAGGYLGKDVQFVPHLTNEIKSWIKKAAQEYSADFCIIEIGGTVGDLENSYFIEAARQLAQEERENTLFVQLTYVPFLSSGEPKTKPTQHSNRLIRSLGIHPQIIVCRTDEKLTKEAKEKISLYCNIEQDCIFEDPKVEFIYELPLVLEKQNFSQVLLSKFNITDKKASLENWAQYIQKLKNPTKKLNIAISGKYTSVIDAYASVKEAIVHASCHLNIATEVDFVDTELLENGKEPKDFLSKYDGIIVPGGFGSRGIDGKIKAIKYARENMVPFLGLCLGMQLMVIEYARNVANIKDATSEEFDENATNKVIHLLPSQQKINQKGGTMRLGSWECILQKGTKAYQAYKAQRIFERHRHRYEVNNDYIKILEEKGLIFSGKSPDGKIVEMCEWPNSWGLATQAHAEFKSRLENPSPLFIAFLEACLNRK
ncbi:MAG: CTP synthase (glutamine hydrolyzing) [Candidatus Omnitrophica bacterium]|nr:CTP synthase (glutamine hydrolyzing) [Candidatus Omnitrophota bacterium]